MSIDSIINESRAFFFFFVFLSSHAMENRLTNFAINAGFQHHESICNGMDCALKVEQTHFQRNHFWLQGKIDEQKICHD